MKLDPNKNEDSEKEKDKTAALVKELALIGASKLNAIFFHVNLEGIGVSIVDEIPRELMFLSIYKIQLSLIKELKLVDNKTHMLEEQ